MSEFDDLADLLKEGLGSYGDRRSALRMRAGRKYALSIAEHARFHGGTIAARQSRSASKRKIKPVITLAKVSLPE